MSQFQTPPSLYKQRSWSPDMCREEVWLRRKNRRRRENVTDEDLDELKACFELGFGFHSPDRLTHTLPALHLFYAVNNNHSDSKLDTPHTIFVTGGNPEAMKARLRQWAQVVACSVRQCSFP